MARQPDSMLPVEQDGGFTIAELLVVLVIIGVVATMGIPSLARNRSAAEGLAFADLVARAMQRARMDAIGRRVPQYVFVYSDRVEVRSAKSGATPSAPSVAPSASDAPVSVVRANPGVSILDATTARTTPDGKVTRASSKQVVFGSLGTGHLAPAAPFVPSAVYLYIENANVEVSHPNRRFRIDLAPLTGYVQLRTGW